MSRAICAAALAILKGAECCRLHAYPDPGSGGAPWTIGWGATGAGIHAGVVWSQSEADARLVMDLAGLCAEMERACGPAPTSDNQFGAMVSLAYNIGIGNFRASSVLRFHRAGDHIDAGHAFASWNKAGGRVLAGLVTRRAAEAKLYLETGA